MTNKHTSQKGAWAEIVATAWLIATGHYVFRNVIPTGPVDLVAMYGREIILIDVKSVPEGFGIPRVSKKKFVYRRPLEVDKMTTGGNNIDRRKPSQVALGVRLLNVYPNGRCEWDRHSFAANDDTPRSS